MKLGWADSTAVQVCGTLSRNELTRNLSGNIQPQSSQLIQPLWTDPGMNKELVFGSKSPPQKKKKKSTGRE